MNSFKNIFDHSLPYSSLRGECICDKEYLHAVNVWNMFEMKIIGDYPDLYLKADVLLIADVFEKCFGVSLEYYGLDSFHYFRSLGIN